MRLLRPSPAPSILRGLPLFAVIALAATTSLPAQNPAPAPVPVVLAEARLDHVTEELPLTGTVTARQQAALSPRAAGLVATVHVDAGDHVKTGDKLVTLDSTLAALVVERTQAALAESRALLAESQRLRDESRQLLADNTIATTEAKTREAALTVATAASARLKVEAREAAELLARHTVIAPFDGVVTAKLTDAGEWVATGTPVLRLVTIDQARVDVQIPQERFAEIAADTPVNIHPDARPGTSLPARVTARVPVSDPAARSALVRIEPVDTQARLLPGKSARVVFRLRSATPVLTVPRDALVRRPDGTVNVWIASRSTDDAWSASPRRVDLGRTFSDLVEIRSGLEPGQQVVIRGNETLRDGQPVRPVAATASATPNS